MSIQINYEINLIYIIACISMCIGFISLCLHINSSRKLNIITKNINILKNK